MTAPRPLKIGITCYPSVGGSGILATALGEELVRRGHEVHFISYERPFRLPADVRSLYFHPVSVSDYNLFKYPDYTLPLSVKMAEISREAGLDVLHAHYAVPHATAAVLARSMLPEHQRPAVVTTLHGTDTTLLGRDPGYGPAITHALNASDAITTVSAYLQQETRRLLGTAGPIDVIHNFFTPRPPRRTADAVRAELGLPPDRPVVVHMSNLRPGKRIDLLLQVASRIRPRDFALLILAGDDFAPHWPAVHRLGLESNVIVRERVADVEDYLQLADAGLFTSESESFCLSILELMYFGCPSVAPHVGGIPEVTDNGMTGLLLPFGDVDLMSAAVSRLLTDEALNTRLGTAARERATTRFSANAIVPLYEALYRRVRAVAVILVVLVAAALASSAPAQQTADKATTPTSRLLLDDEPDWNAAEESAAANQLDPAVDRYLKVLRTTQKPWLKTRASVRLLDVAARASRYDAVITGYLSLVHTEPGQALARRPALPPGDSAYVENALTETDRALGEPGLTDDQKQSLLSLQLDLYRIRKDDARADRVLEQLNELSTPSAPLSGTAAGGAARRFVDTKLTEARVALDRADPGAAVTAINSAKPALTDPASQEEALYLLARAADERARGAGGGGGTSHDALKDAGLAYMRVVAQFQDVSASRRVPDALAGCASVLERLGETKIAADLYEQAAIQYDTRPDAATARASARRLRDAAATNPARATTR